MLVGIQGQVKVTVGSVSGSWAGRSEAVGHHIDSLVDSSHWLLENNQPCQLMT